ncbi:type 1 glutamine amidotransferase domain-containing protein [Aliikangiella coralliicola]|uniref:Type 1 glutamine amidotransferase domain-containing protein n=1 Tax=Aliikangiella coralliicola TaxID=2592383 RepID=A0A545U8W8_9GAMM|nr:type 1 glutamine amidotransferase domain-containing protein [Aliikangiella coralliicola]TQV85916.1 type 1 glutamine amidotransferase domain-containing protein [Aliikangiella coralliicola]
MLKKILISTLILVTVLVGSFYGGKAWLKSLLPDKAHFQALKQTQTSDLPYVTENIPANRGKILAVVTNVSEMGIDEETGEARKTGYEHTELARAYWVFIANGFEVDIASPKGGKPPVVIDGEDMGAYDYAFLNDVAIQQQIDNSIPLADIDPSDYEAVYFVGGKGTMFDFPDNKDIQRITKALYQDGKVVSAVCHGPAALVNVQLDNGEMLLANKQVSGFTNEEELILISDAKEIFPFMLEDKLIEQGAQFQAGNNFLEKVSQDGKLITGQNPWSVWTMAEMVVEELGYEPKERARTPEEFSIELLMTYEKYGLETAKEELKKQPESYQRVQLLMHAVLAFMQYEISKGVDILSLVEDLKELAG